MKYLPGNMYITYQYKNPAKIISVRVSEVVWMFVVQ